MFPWRTRYPLRWVPIKPLPKDVRGPGLPPADVTFADGDERAGLVLGDVVVWPAQSAVEDNVSYRVYWASRTALDDAVPSPLGELGKRHEWGRH